jgi:hypothetical protein
MIQEFRKGKSNNSHTHMDFNFAKTTWFFKTEITQLGFTVKLISHQAVSAFL